MKLKDYLKTNGRTYEQFAQAIRVSPVSVYRYASGRQLPDRDVLPRIYAATDGAVTPNDFFDFLPKGEGSEVR